MTYFKVWVLGIGVAIFALSCGGPPILDVYQSLIAPRGGYRYRPHTGVDFRGPLGSPVLAAAEGAVRSVFDHPDCGIGILLEYTPFDYLSYYCHFQKVLVSPGQRVKRGDVIGLIGTTGLSSNIPHVHLEVCTFPCRREPNPQGDLEDPLTISVGCFDPKKTYPTEKLVLTYPVECRD